MARMPVKSNTKKSKEIIRQEIRWCFAPKVRGYGKSSLDNMRAAANSASHDIPTQQTARRTIFRSGEEATIRTLYVSWTELI